MRSTISFADDLTGAEYVEDEYGVVAPFDRHSSRFADQSFSPLAFRGETPTAEVFTPKSAPSRPITSPQATAFTDGDRTNLRAPYVRKRGIYYPGHDTKCPSLEDQKNDDLEVPGPGSYHRMHLVKRQNSEYQFKRGTYDMFGFQIDSRKRSAPSFRFGNQAFPVARATVSNTVTELNTIQESSADKSLFARMMRSSQAAHPKMLSTQRDLNMYFTHKTPSVVLPQIMPVLNMTAHHAT